MGEDEVEKTLRVVRGARVMVMVWRDRDGETTKPMGYGRPNERGDVGKQDAKERRARLHGGHARLQRVQEKKPFLSSKEFVGRVQKPDDESECSAASDRTAALSWAGLAGLNTGQRVH
jgi:hypothetical protein